MTDYLNQRLAEVGAQTKSLQNQTNVLALTRGFLGFALLVSIYFFIRYDVQTWTWLVFGLGVIVFFTLLVLHGKRRKLLTEKQALQKMYEEELAFLDQGVQPNSDGSVYKPAKHDYANDLDVFGKFSLYHVLNRTHTPYGEDLLAEKLLETSGNEKVEIRQEAVREMSQNLDFMFDFRAKTSLINQSRQTTDAVVAWMATNPRVVAGWQKYLAWLLPAGFMAAALLLALKGGDAWYQAMVLFFIANLFHMAAFMKDIKLVLGFSDEIEKVLMAYSEAVAAIEMKTFSSAILKGLHSDFKGKSAGQRLGELKTIFNNLNTAANPMGLVLIGGMVQFHLHVFFKLLRWKTLHGKDVHLWLNQVGEMEAMVSLGNFANANPNFVYPEINREAFYKFSSLGHPLIPVNQRVVNDFELRGGEYVILTGSNMAGKSTFLRTIGVNLILARAGAPVCAEKALLDPCRLLVSMGISDSLGENSSYFFAEIQRLKYIMVTAQKEKCLVLLDEILRGTNSVDKTNGTRAYLKQLLNTSSFGILATHDLEVCTLEEDFPDKLVNKHFASAVIDGKLFFDYKLKEGLCTSKNAMFLLKQNGIVDQD